MRALSFQVFCAAAVSTFSITLQLLTIFPNWIAFAAKSFSSGTLAFGVSTAFAFAAFTKEDLCILFISEVGNQGGNALSRKASVLSKSLPLALAFVVWNICLRTKRRTRRTGFRM